MSIATGSGRVVDVGTGVVGVVPEDPATRLELAQPASTNAASTATRTSRALIPGPTPPSRGWFLPIGDSGLIVRS